MVANLVSLFFVWCRVPCRFRQLVPLNCQFNPFRPRSITSHKTLHLTRHYIPQDITSHKILHPTRHCSSILRKLDINSIVKTHVEVFFCNHIGVMELCDILLNQCVSILKYRWCRGKQLRWSRGSMLAFSIQVHGLARGRSRRIFRAKKSSARLPSEGK
jgi:hypothetical protein